jgi:hypothetical protein
MVLTVLSFSFLVGVAKLSAIPVKIIHEIEASDRSDEYRIANNGWRRGLRQIGKR